MGAQKNLEGERPHVGAPIIRDAGLLSLLSSRSFVLHFVCPCFCGRGQCQGADASGVSPKKGHRGGDVWVTGLGHIWRLQRR